MHYNDETVKAIYKLEDIEDTVCNLPIIFSEVFKNEINANDEERIYNGVKRIIKKFAEDKKSLEILNEFTSVLCGGAALSEILNITREEALTPTIASELTVNNDCRIDDMEH